MIRQDEYGADPAYAGAEDEGLQVRYLSTYARLEIEADLISQLISPLLLFL